MTQDANKRYTGQLFMTRLHLRYNRSTFPQDLRFIATPNKERFQGRYVVQNAVKGDLQCDQAQNYYKKVVQRREKEIQQLASLTGWAVADHQYYVREYASKIKGDNSNGWIENNFNRNSIIPIGGGGPGGCGPGGLFAIVFILMTLVTGWRMSQLIRTRIA